MSDSHDDLASWDDLPRVGEDVVSRIIGEGLLPCIGDYSLKVTLGEDYEIDTIVRIHADILHHQLCVGSLKGMVIDRCKSPSWQFHSLCDGISEELFEIGELFCNNDGTLRYKDIQGLSKTQDQQASRGGFLHIEMITIEEQHRHNDVGVRCIKALFEWLNERDASEEQQRSKQVAELVKERELSQTTIKRLDALQPWNHLQAGWTIAVLQSELDKVALQWARLGFQQASSCSEFWYVVPSRLCLKRKSEVAHLVISVLPEAQEVCPFDQPLIDYLETCVNDAGEVKATFQQDIRAFVDAGAVLSRARALHRAVRSGLSSPSDLGFLIGRGVDPNMKDEFGHTPLMVVSLLLGDSAAKRARAVTAATALISFGADRSIADCKGDRPVTNVLKQIQSYEDMDDMYGGPGRRRSQEKEWWELVSVLLEPQEQRDLFQGVLTPRQLYRMQWYADIKGDEASVALQYQEFQKGVPRPSEEMELDVPYWDYIPKAVRGKSVFKSFVLGYTQIIQAMSLTISPRTDSSGPELPTIDVIKRNLARGGYGNRCTDFFFSKGGKIEFALDGFISTAAESEEFFDDATGMEFCTHLENYEALPEHPLDDVWSFVHYRLLGPPRQVPVPPIHVQAPMPRPMREAPPVQAAEPPRRRARTVDQSSKLAAEPPKCRALKPFGQDRAAQSEVPTIGPEDSISNLGDSTVESVPASIPVPSSVSAASGSVASLVSAAGSERKCYLPGWRLPCISGGLVPIERLSLGDRLQAATGDEVRVTFLRLHPGPHQVATLQVGEASLVVTTTHRLLLQRGGQRVPALASSVVRGDDIFCESGVQRVLADPVVSLRDCGAYEVRFEPDLPLATFPPDVLLTMGSRAHRGRRRGAPFDLLSLPPTEDGFA